MSLKFISTYRETNKMSLKIISTYRETNKMSLKISSCTKLTLIMLEIVESYFSQVKDDLGKYFRMEYLYVDSIKHPILSNQEVVLNSLQTLSISQFIMFNAKN